MCLWEIESIQLLSLIQSDSISPGTRLYRDVPKGRTYKLASLLDRTECYTHIRYYWWILNEWNNTWIWLVQLHKLAESRSVFVWILRSQKTTACVMMMWLKFEPSSRLMRVKLVQYFTVGVCVYWQSKEKQKYHVEWKEIWDMEKLESFNNVSGPSNRHHLVPMDYLT